MHSAPARRATNLSLDSTLLAEARELKVNLSRAAEDGIRQEVENTRRGIWRAENREALHSSNAYVDENGLPLDRHRQF